MPYIILIYLYNHRKKKLTFKGKNKLEKTRWKDREAKGLTQRWRETYPSGCQGPTHRVLIPMWTMKPIEHIWKQQGTRRKLALSSSLMLDHIAEVCVFNCSTSHGAYSLTLFGLTHITFSSPKKNVYIIDFYFPTLNKIWNKNY